MPFATSEALIEVVEQSLERRLPEPLRLRLLRSNGGEVSTSDDDWILHPIRDASDRKRLARIANDIIRETEQARQWRSFPQGAIAIGANGLGDLLVIRSGSDVIERWDHRTGELQTVSVNWD